jgi:hypothetical protein
MDLRNSGGPQPANVNGIVGYAVVDQPVPRVKPAVPTEASALGSHRIHVREMRQHFYTWQDFVPITVWQEQQQVTHKIGPDDSSFHFRFLERARDIRTTSL